MWVAAIFASAEQKQLSIAIARLEDENLSLFLEDPTVYAGYIEEVPCPMYLNLITTRLEDCYYRTLAHIRHDIGLLLSNFKLYNKGEPFDWVEEVQEMLFECVESKSQCPDASNASTRRCAVRVPRLNRCLVHP